MPKEESGKVPLLQPSDGCDRGRGEEEEELQVGLGRRILEENRKLWVVAGPPAFIGHIGATELAAYALVSTVLMRFGTGVLLGMASVLGTLCGQSYGGKQYHMLGIYLQRSWIILLAASVLLLPIYIFTQPLLILLGQDPGISAVAGVISLWYIPVIFANVFTYTLQMYLQAQSKNTIITYLAMLNLGLHLFLSWLMTVKYSLGIAGAMGSLVIASWVPVLGQLGFAGFSSAAFSDLGAIVKLSISSGFMLCLELWYNTVLVFLAGYMKNAEIALNALSICLNINGLEMMISVGFLGATGVRIANELGAKSARRAKFAILNVVTTSFSIGVVLFVLFLVLRGKLANIFTESRVVADAIDDLSPLLAFSILLNSLQPVLSGVAVGAGWQSVVAYVNAASYYLIGIPLGAFLGYVVGFHLKGLWTGMLIGTFIQTIILLVEISQESMNRWGH
ncbi:hypothetical protein BRADI_1g00272v3 [Brachypodium distachyon]|uniref:Protein DETOXIFICATION n=1 Tax=Brachypodium distachyon TaxID=15368 RepID=A0A0Q3GN40_BRADI|nr:hypothetical protein BRADI_1g00272v3 [Brachypodium distachyon]